MLFTRRLENSCKSCCVGRRDLEPRRCHAPCCSCHVDAAPAGGDGWWWRWWWLCCCYCCISSDVAASGLWSERDSRRRRARPHPYSARARSPPSSA
ncbi:Os04g0368150 [Oryza sativa Japonica Group]|uniref:Os04g0368150 protein n=1 Tax=Oryza sativa subsp. japonica TaxID=39947 RepID=A0A0P0W936_ORYSJ|nr:Os04g0368150 [Oryza sativa Japonica Group]